MNTFLIIIIIFLIFIIFQVYFYMNVYQKNDKLIKKIESFQGTLDVIDKEKYVLDDDSLSLLLDDYNELNKENI